uniref:Methyltransf_11 domain-containing protein n=1 Tax=Heterorhabditis bacteriophora TaxID=37862 RepID=A0A1I7WIW2_HETBA
MRIKCGSGGYCLTKGCWKVVFEWIFPHLHIFLPVYRHDICVSAFLTDNRIFYIPYYKSYHGLGTTTIFMDSILLIFVAVRGPEITCFESLLSQRQISRSLGPLTLDCEFRAFFIFPALVDCMRRGGVLHGNESSCMKGLSSGRIVLGHVDAAPFFPRSEVDAVITVLYVKSIISTIPKILIRAVEAREESIIQQYYQRFLRNKCEISSTITMWF